MIIIITQHISSFCIHKYLIFLYLYDFFSVTFYIVQITFTTPSTDVIDEDMTAFLIHSMVRTVSTGTSESANRIKKVHGYLDNTLPLLLCVRRANMLPFFRKNSPNFWKCIDHYSLYKSVNKRPLNLPKFLDNCTSHNAPVVELSELKQ